MSEDEGQTARGFSVVVETSLIGKDALLKTCYWLSRDFYHQASELGPSQVRIDLTLKPSARTELRAFNSGDFINVATDFHLRSQIDAQTASIREIILAKAFSESGVFETDPQGVFADLVEDAKPDGLFRILDQGNF